MAYKYFTEKLLSSGTLDLTDVFPEKQEIARESQNVSYNLADIAIFIKDRTENFKRIEAQYVDLDNAISEIVNKYYKSKGEKNPFITEVDEEALKEFESKVPREPAIVEKGELKGKGVPKAAPEVKVKKEVKIKEEPVKEPVVVEVVGETKVVVPSDIDGRIERYKEELASQKEIFEDVYDDSEKEDLINYLETDLSGSEILADDDEYFAKRVGVLKQFIDELKKLK